MTGRNKNNILIKLIDGTTPSLHYGKNYEHGKKSLCEVFPNEAVVAAEDWAERFFFVLTIEE